MNEKEIQDYIDQYVEMQKKALDSLPRQGNGIYTLIKVLLRAYDRGNKVITFGNGGSGSLAAHLTQDLAKHVVVSDSKSEVVVEKRFKTLCLNESVACLTTWANDVGYDRVFSEQLINWVEPGDVVIGITGSGNTENVLKALEVANKRRATTVALTGGSGGKVKDTAWINIIIDSNVNYCVEDALSSVVHITCDVLRSRIQGETI
jgi:D-sedoheptulose 7-phosphate isomerase